MSAIPVPQLELPELQLPEFLVRHSFDDTALPSSRSVVPRLELRAEGPDDRRVAAAVNAARRGRAASAARMH